MKFSFRNKIFVIKKLSYKNVNNSYVKRAQNMNLMYAKNSIKDQIEYIRSVRKRNDEIFQISYKNKLIATSGFQFRGKITYQGILIINNKFIGKKYSKYFIISFVLYVSRKYKKNLFCAGIKKSNTVSIKSFIKAGYELKKKNKDGLYLYLNIKKKNQKLLRFICII